MYPKETSGPERSWIGLSSPLPCSPEVGYKVRGKMPYPVTSGVTREVAFKPEEVRRPRTTPIPKLQRQRIFYTNYGQKTQAYGKPEIVRQLKLGTLPPTYFAELAYGRRVGTAPSTYKGPVSPRDKPLWQPKQVSREQTRKRLIDIQDARFRRQETLEKMTSAREHERMQREETARLREAETMPRGLKAYLGKLEKVTAKYEEAQKSKRSQSRPQTAENLHPPRSSLSL